MSNEELIQRVQALAPEERAELAAQLALPSIPTDPGQAVATRTVGTIWLASIGALAATVLLFGTFAFVKIDDATAAALLMTPATTALGALVGLLAPSPTAAPATP